MKANMIIVGYIKNMVIDNDNVTITLESNKSTITVFAGKSMMKDIIDNNIKNIVITGCLKARKNKLTVKAESIEKF